MSVSACIAYQADGIRCRASARLLDHQRGGIVCLGHVPLAVAQAIAHAEAYGSAHENLEHEGQRYTWRLGWDEAVGERYRQRFERREEAPPC